MGNLATVLFGLVSALTWGAGDFCGGLATRRSSVLSVLIVAESSGLVLLVVSALVFREPLPSPSVVAWSVVGGLTGTIGLAVLYRGLAVGRASIVAPVSAVVSSAVPALFSAFTIGLPEPLKLLGFALAFVAIVLAGQASREERGINSLRYGFLAGLGFGGFFIFIAQAGSASSTFFPVAVARGIVIPVLIGVSLARRTPLPPRNVLPVTLLSGILDASGNIFFLLSSIVGRLDVATILSSLYPASTVILSRVILQEKLNRLQQLGVLFALAAIILIAI